MKRPARRREVTVEIGTKVQSVPGADEKPQTFETIEEIEARAWNGTRSSRQLTAPPLIAAGLTSLYLKGTATRSCSQATPS